MAFRNSVKIYRRYLKQYFPFRSIKYQVRKSTNDEFIKSIKYSTENNKKIVKNKNDKNKFSEPSVSLQSLKTNTISPKSFIDYTIDMLNLQHINNVAKIYLLKPKMILNVGCSKYGVRKYNSYSVKNRTPRYNPSLDDSNKYMLRKEVSHKQIVSQIKHLSKDKLINVKLTNIKNFTGSGLKFDKYRGVNIDKRITLAPPRFCSNPILHRFAISENVRKFHTSNKNLIQPIRECPKPPPPKEICGYLKPPKPSKPKCKIKCPKNWIELLKFQKCTPICLPGCKPKNLENYCEGIPVCPKMVKLEAPLPAFSECRCVPAAKPLLCPECFPSFPTCANPSRDKTILCKPQPKPRRVECLERVHPVQKPWSEEERCNPTDRCSDPYRIDDIIPPKVYKPLPPIFPLPQKREYSTLISKNVGKIDYVCLSDNIISKRNFANWDPPPCKIHTPKDCSWCKNEKDEIIREMRRKLEGDTNCLIKIRPARGHCVQPPKIILGNMSSYEGHRKPFSTLIFVHNYCTFSATHPVFPATSRVKCRGGCCLRKQDIQKIRNQLEGCCPIPQPCEIPEALIKPSSNRIVKSQCTIPKLDYRPIQTKPFGEKNCMDIRELTEGGRCKKKCRGMIKLQVCKTPCRILCYDEVYYKCKKTDCPFPAYSECKEEDEYRTSNECDYCQESVTPEEIRYAEMFCRPCLPLRKCKVKYNLPFSERPLDDRRHLFCKGLGFSTYASVNNTPHSSTSIITGKIIQTVKKINNLLINVTTVRNYSSAHKSLQPNQKFFLEEGVLLKNVPTARRIDVTIAEKCYKQKCHEIMFEPPDAGTVECPKTPECDTPENRARYCKPQRRDTYTCDLPPESQGRVCACPFKKKNNNNLKKSFSTFFALKRNYGTDSGNKLVHPRPVDPLFEEKCYLKRCADLDQMPDAGTTECPKTPVCDTPENRKKFCRGKRADTYDCFTGPERTKSGCFSMKCPKMKSNSSPKCESDCKTRKYSTSCYVSNNSQTNYNVSVLLNSLLNSMQKYFLLRKLKYISNYENLKKLHFKSQNPCDTLMLPLDIACPAPMPQTILPVQCEQNKFKCMKDTCKACNRLTESLAEKKGKCKKICIPGCKQVPEKLFCEEVSLLPCETVEPPYQSFSEKKTFKFRYRPLNECVVTDNIHYNKQVKSAKFRTIPNEGKKPAGVDECRQYSTYTRSKLNSVISSEHYSVLNRVNTNKSIVHSLTSQIRNFNTQSSYIKIQNLYETKQKYNYSNVCQQRSSFDFTLQDILHPKLNQEDVKWNSENSSTKETDHIMRDIYSTEKNTRIYDSWEEIPSTSLLKFYNDKVLSKKNLFENGSIKGHFKKNYNVSTFYLSNYNVRKYSSNCSKKMDVTTKKKCPQLNVCAKKSQMNFTETLEKILKYFKARPNCPDPSEYKKNKLLKKAQKAAKAAGLQLCDIQVKASNPNKESEKPEGCPDSCPPKEKTSSEVKMCQPTSDNSCKKKVCKKDNKAAEKSKCEKMCIPGCKPPTDRLFCVEEVDVPPCKPVPPPYPSFSEAQRFEFARPRINECSFMDELFFKKMVENAKMKPLPEKVSKEKDEKNECGGNYSAKVNALSQKGLMQKRGMSTSSVVRASNNDNNNIKNNIKNNKSNGNINYPLEMSGECEPLPFKPPCDEMVLGEPPPCTPYEAPPPPPPPCKYPCPTEKKTPKPPPRCGLPPGPPEILIDKCKRYRECCRPPAKPPVFPCDDDCV